MAELTVCFHTGEGDFVFEGSLADAMEEADARAAYTGQPITIEDSTGNEVARRSWCGVLTGIEDAQAPIQFGDFGYYGDWYQE